MAKIFNHKICLDKDSKWVSLGNHSLAVVGLEGKAVVSQKSVAIAGISGEAIAGDKSTAIAGACGVAIAGLDGVAIVDTAGTAIVGVGGRVAGGLNAVLSIDYINPHTGYTGAKSKQVDGIKIKFYTFYKLNKDYEFEEDTDANHAHRQTEYF